MHVVIHFGPPTSKATPISVSKCKCFRDHLQDSEVLQSSEVILVDACEVISIQLPEKET